MIDEKGQNLFDEFPGITAKEWEEVIIKDLKGADYDKKLLWRTTEGFAVKPFYREEDTKGLPHLLPGKGINPLFSGNKKSDNNWLIRQEIVVRNIAEANKKALKAINGGCSSVCFVTNENKDGGLTFNFNEQAEFSALLKDIDVEKVLVCFQSGTDTPAIASMFEEEMKSKKHDLSKINVHFDSDPAGYVSLSGNFFNSEGKDEALDILYKIHNVISKSLPSSRYIGVHGNYFADAGADTVQELAFSLSMANEYFAFLTEKNINIGDIAKFVSFSFSTGSNYFIEIAKLRAARFLYSKILSAYNNFQPVGSSMNINSVTSGWNKTIYDPHVNLLRCTTEAMSAITGGCDSLTVLPFDKAYSTPDDFSDRIARNIQNLLKEESNLDKVIDPAAGSYYIENLTSLIIEKTWALFNTVEDKGGYFKAFSEGFIQEEIKRSRNTHYSNVSGKKEIILGTNQYPNLNETAHERVADKHECKECKDKKHVAGEPLSIYRIADEFEQLRLFTENNMKPTPAVFMLTYGNLAMRKARAAFSTNFFGCAGFRIIDNPGFCNVEEAVNAAILSKAEIVVLCSSDDEYKETVADYISRLNDKCILVLAGYPADMVETYKNAGLKHFIHVKSDVVGSLKEFQQLVISKR